MKSRVSSTPSNIVRIGLAGFGTVGGATYRNLAANLRLLEERCGVRPVVTRIASLPMPGLPKKLLVRSPLDLAASPDTDLVVELMGGYGLARDLVLAALRAGKPVVTANKALLAVHGPEIFGEADRRGVPIFFEASVAGGVPLLKAVRESLVVNRFQLIYGIVNGTCNYILSRMSQEGLGFDAALQQAQALGYAERDPTFDVEGIDAAHKATLLASLATGGSVDFKSVHVEGIRSVTDEDMRFAHQLGYEIKLLAIIRAVGSAEVEVRVHPTLIPKCNRVAGIHGVTNSIMVRGHVVGDIEFSGPGAGGDATSSAVIADIAEAAALIVRSRTAEPSGGCGLPHSHAICIRGRGPRVTPIENVLSRFYLRFSAVDQPGVMARISSILGSARIGISSIVQPEGRGRIVPLVLMTHAARHDAMFRALGRIRKLSCIKGKPVVLRVEDFKR